MSDEHNPETTEAVHATRSGRRLTVWRKLGYRIVARLGWLVVELLWRTARLRIEGEDRLRQLLDQYGAVVPVCWHQHLLLCARYAASGRVSKFKTGFLISPSVDGEGPALLAAMYDAEVIRGSSTYTGTRAVRQLAKQVKHQKLSPLITPDGPRGPRFKFKGGATTVAQLCEVPVVPLVFAARPAKVFGTWDKFVLPAPFARIVIMIGEPVIPPRKMNQEQSEALNVEMERRMHDTFRQAADILKKNAS